MSEVNNSTHALTQNMTFDPESNAGLMLPYALLDDVLHESQVFNKNTDPFQGHYLLNEFFDFSDAMQKIPGRSGVFATGHPFYAFQADGSVAYIPEIDRFIEETRQKATADSWRFAGKWACSGCQLQTNLPDLKQICRPCDVVELKPRDVFKALPDLDFWVVVEKNNPAIEAQVELRANQAGFYPSDVSVYRSINETQRVLKAINRGEKVNSRLPVDMHVVTREELYQGLAGLDRMAKDNSMNFVPMQPRSLHVKWERADTPYNFVQDFLLALTEAGMEDNLQAEIMKRRRLLAASYTNGQLFHKIFDTDAKSARQLSNPAMMKILAGRLNGWREL